MTAPTLKGKPVAIFMGEVLTDMGQAAAALEKAEADLAALRTLLVAAQAANLSHTERLNRSVDIENYLINASKGNRELPNAEDCKVMALRLGTPYEHWTDYLKKHKYGANSNSKSHQVIIIEHDGHRFVTSANQIDSEEEMIGVYVAYIHGVMRQIKRKSVYGEIIVDKFKAGEFSKC